MTAGDESTKRAIAEALEETQLGVRDLRDLGAGLDPSVLAHRGLAAAITSLTARTPVPVALELPAERFAPLVESTAYFVVSEALANVAKHADASEASVTIGTRPGGLAVTVADDGRGGAVAEPAAGPGSPGSRTGWRLSVEAWRSSRRPAAGPGIVAQLPLGDGVSEPAAA